MLTDMSEKVSYLQGLSEGLNITDGSPQGKIISGILNVLNEMADEISTMQNDFDEIREYIEDLDDDLLELEETVFEEDEFMELNCNSCGEKLYIENDIFDDEDTIEIICPRCNEVVYVNDGSFDYSQVDLEQGIDSPRNNV